MSCTVTFLPIISVLISFFKYMLIGLCISVLFAWDLIFNSKVRTELHPLFCEYEYTIQWWCLILAMYMNTIFLQIPDYPPVGKWKIFQNCVQIFR